ncbi:alpha/beta hydrolase [Chromobacterium violaceum]|uniref:alpha/beta hydrolase n=1 Tax=Chromobacterium violaceum TaxID=536 RepID=UPI0009D954C0|nr:alpha/beta hydrolase [Chromobacterium violaceum]OQS45615.1 carboxylesterase [Chromobacterium violaceum]OQS47403.1 carboxylesterase [Chromobacterium violaceum]
MLRLHPNLQPWLAELNRQTAQRLAEGYKPTAIGAREALAQLTAQMVSPGPAIAWVNDDLVHGGGYPVPVRIYHPEPGAALPVLVFLHGGGHMAGGVSVYDGIHRRLAAASRHIVVAAEYRLSPENPYPAGLDDALCVARHVWDTLDGRGLAYRRRLSLAGDSAGGALCASVSGLAGRDPSLDIARQALIYPCVDYTLDQPSVAENGEGFFLTRARTDWYFNNYFQHGEDRRQASPLHWEAHGQMPATLLITAGHDILRDQGQQYARKLQAAGAEVTLLHLEDQVHAFLNMEALVPEVCELAYRRIGAFLNAG